MGARYRPSLERHRRLQRELEEMLPRLVDDRTEKVILFGSTGRGGAGATSDLDLLVVRRDARRPAERIDDLYRRVRPRVAVDLLVYTPEELLEAEATSSFVRNVLREGKVIYDRGRSLDRASQA